MPNIHFCHEELYAILALLPVVSGVALTIRSWISKIKKVK